MTRTEEEALILWSELQEGHQTMTDIEKRLRELIKFLEKELIEHHIALTAHTMCIDVCSGDGDRGGGAMRTERERKKARSIVGNWAGMHDDEVEAEGYRELVDRIAAALSASPVPAWSTEQPTVPGWYWYRGLPFSGEKGRGTIVEVRLLNLDNVEPLWMWDIDVRIPVSETAGEWCAIPFPQEGGAHDRG